MDAPPALHASMAHGEVPCWHRGVRAVPTAPEPGWTRFRAYTHESCRSERPIRSRQSPEREWQRHRGRQQAATWTEPGNYRLPDRRPTHRRSPLDPLAKSTLHYLRLLLEPDAIRLREVRTTIEIQRVWERYESVTSHVVLIGHGNPDSIRLLDCNRPVSGNEFARFLQDAAPTTAPKTFVSLSCLTGRQPFAKPFSQSEVCADFLAPFQSVHSAAASLFAQSYFAHHLLNGAGVIAAFTHARRAVGSGVSFRHWRNGDLTPTPDL